jgi:cytochrome c oxidase assembly protein subunit 11
VPSFVLTCFVIFSSFCFEEQRLAPHEEVDMPVFFYIDPDILDDKRLRDVSSITLSYTFFRSKDQIVEPKKD